MSRQRSIRLGPFARNKGITGEHKTENRGCQQIIPYLSRPPCTIAGSGGTTPSPGTTLAMLCRLATTASRRATATVNTSAASSRQQTLLSTTSLLVCGRPSSSTTAVSRPLHAATAAATTASDGVELAPPRTRNLSSSASAPAAESISAPKLVFGIPKVDDVARTPPMEEEDSGPVIREMRVQLRPPNEQGSRGARRIRRGAWVKESCGESFCELAQCTKAGTRVDCKAESGAVCTAVA